MRKASRPRAWGLCQWVTSGPSSRGRHGFFRTGCTAGGGVAHLLRLIAFLSLAFVSSAHAQSCSRGVVNYSSFSLGSNTTFYYGGDAGIAFDAAAASACRGEYQWNSGTPRCLVAEAPYVPPYAPANVSITAGLSWSGVECSPPVVDEQQQLCNSLNGTETYGTVSGNMAPGSSACNASGCMATFAGTVLRVKDASGQYVTEGAMTFTDQKCTFSADTGATEDTCPGGTSGEVNGVTVCVNFDPKTNTIESVKATTSTTANGSGTATATSTSTTTCSNGSCNSTTTTVINNNGTTSSETKTTDEPQSDFCAKNPKDPQCTDEGSFSGSCAGGFTCTGDAVQCALAREVHAQNCKLNATTDESALYDLSKGKEGNQTTDLPGNGEHTFGPVSFDQSDALGGGTCITDLTLEVLGNSVTLPTSNVCPYLLWLRSALLAIGAILWIVIVFRS